MDLMNRIVGLRDKVDSAEKKDLILQGEIKNMESEIEKEFGTVDLNIISAEIEKKEKDNLKSKENLLEEIEKLEDLIL